MKDCKRVPFHEIVGAVSDRPIPLLNSAVAAAWKILLLAIAFGAVTNPVFAQITVSGVADKSVYTDKAVFTIVTQAGYSYSATLNGLPVPVGTAVTVSRMDYYDLSAWRTNLSSPYDVTNRLVRFIIIAGDRGSPEQGLIKWTPYPRIYSTAAEFAGAQLHVMTPQDYPAGLPIPVIVRVDDGQDNERRCNGGVNAPGFAGHGVQVIRGVGSGLLPAAAESARALDYDAQLHSLRAPKKINIDTNTAWTPVSGVLTASSTWPENSRIYLTGHFGVPANLSLTIGAGTIVKLNPLVNFTNSGQILINGTAERPVVFTSTNVVWPGQNAGAWGGFLLRGAAAQLTANATIFAGGGGAPSFNFSPSASHKSEQAVLLVHSGARVNLTNCAIINTAGQVHNGYASDITYDHCLAQRAITGGECSGGGTVIINHSAFIEFPADNGVVDAEIADADYDALYFTEGTHILRNSLIGFSMDDALDSGSGGAGTMWVTNCWIESSLHEAHAWSGEGRRCWTYDSVLMNCGQGLENGYSTGDNSPICNAERILSTANSVGLRVGDNYNWSYNGYLNVTNSLVLHNYRDLFLKTWNSATATGWDTNSWVDRVEQCRFGTNFISSTDPRFPSNLPWDPERDGWRLAHWMTTPPEAPVGIGLALRTNRLSLAQITNGVPVRLSSFTTNFVSVDYALVGIEGPVASGTLRFAPGETVKTIPPYLPATNEQVLEVLLRNPAHGELTSLAQAWFLQQSGTNSGPVQLVSAGSRWNYNGNGTDLGTAWRSPAYDDSGWSNGPAQLGFGDGDEQTVLRRTNASGAAISTFYFRQTFVNSNLPPFTDLSLWLLRDDGGVVYLNGNEVFRSDSMPPLPAAITYATLATNYNGGAAPPDDTIDRVILAPDLLTGTNVVAVEIHQQALSSSDASFDFALTGNVKTVSSPPTITRSPTNQTTIAGSTAFFSVEAAGGAPLAYQWWHNNSRLIENTIGPVLILTNITSADAGTYHVVVLNNDGSATSDPATLTISEPDTDGDGMPDSWEIAHGLNVGVNDASLDPDADGFSNVQEFVAGTDPRNPASYLRIETVERGSQSDPNSVVLTFQAIAGRTYNVLFTDALPGGSWVTLTEVPALSTNTVVTIKDPQATNSTHRYYRLRTPAGP